MAKRIDISGDAPLAVLYRSLQTLDTPEYVKQAAIETLNTDESSPDRVFADSHNREFPCHNKAATWVSAVYLSSHSSDISPVRLNKVQDQLEKHAAFFGISQDVRKVFASTEKQAYADDTDRVYALVKTVDGEKLRRYPLRNGAEIKAACAYLEEHRNSFSFADRSQMAQKIIDRAAVLEADITEKSAFLNRQAGYGFCTLKAANIAIDNRLNKIPMKLQEVYNGLSEMKKAVAEVTTLYNKPMTMKKLATLLDYVDRECLKDHLKANYSFPEDTLFELGQEKVAAALDDYLTLTTGAVYRRSDIKKASTEDFDLEFGEDFTKTISD
jgi:hypothetical protein